MPLASAASGASRIRANRAACRPRATSAKAMPAPIARPQTSSMVSSPRPIRKPPEGESGDAGKAVGAAGHRLPIDRRQMHELGKAQRGERQIVGISGAEPAGPR